MMSILFSPFSNLFYHHHLPCDFPQSFSPRFNCITKVYGIRDPIQPPYPFPLILLLTNSICLLHQLIDSRPYLLACPLHIIDSLACASTLCFKADNSTQGDICSNRYKVMCGATSGCLWNCVHNKSSITRCACRVPQRYCTTISARFSET